MDSESLKIAYCAERQPKWLSFCEIAKKCYNKAININK